METAQLGKISHLMFTNVSIIAFILRNTRVKTQPQKTYISDLKVLPHEQVERSGGVTPDGADAAAAVTQETQAQVGAQLRVFFKQHLWELDKTTVILGSVSQNKRMNIVAREIVWQDDKVGARKRNSP